MCLCRKLGHNSEVSEEDEEALLMDEAAILNALLESNSYYGKRSEVSD